MPTARIAQHTLSRYNFWVKHVENGRFALNELKIRSYDLILCDILMPVMDGQTFLKEATPHLHSAQVAMLTGLSDKQSVVEAVANKASMYILKPITPTELFQKVKEILSLGEGDIVDKGQSPIQVQVENDLEETVISIKGVPNPAFVEEFLVAVSEDLPSLSSLPVMTLDVEESFYYYEKSLELLDKLVWEMRTNRHFKAKISFQGSYFQWVNRQDITGLINLAATKITFPKKDDEESDAT